MLKTTLLIAAGCQRSVTVGVAAHLSKPSEQASIGYGRWQERPLISSIAGSWMNLMADLTAGPVPSGLPTARSFPDEVPILVDAEAGIRLRAAGRGDLLAMVEQCR